MVNGARSDEVMATVDMWIMTVERQKLSTRKVTAFSGTGKRTKGGITKSHVASSVWRQNPCLGTGISRRWSGSVL